MMETEKISRKEREYLAHREEILSAAEKVFAAKGFFSTTMSDIAREAEFGTGSLYKYFKSKEDLYFTLIDEKVEEINGPVKAELSHKTPAVERIKKVLGLQFEFFERNRDFFRIYASERTRFEWTVKDELGKDLHEKMVAYIHLLAGVMRAGDRGRRVQTPQPHGFGPCLGGDCQFLCLRVDHQSRILSTHFKVGYGFRNFFGRGASIGKEEVDQ